jgi:iron complex transport system substrate-binding protein
MNGHRTPRRASARSHLLPTWQSPLKPRSFQLIFLPLIVFFGAALLFAAGCGTDTTEESDTTLTTVATTTTAAEAVEGTFPATVTDDNQESVTIEAKPIRIVSTAPANTETLFALGLGDRVVGVTSLDDYPPEAAAITKIGDFQPNPEAITALSPDLVVGYSGNEEPLAPIKSAGTPVLILNPATVDQIYANIATIGTATGATGKAAELVESIKAQMAEVTEAAKAAGEPPRVFYALDNTLWTAGPGSFVDELLALANAANVAAEPGADGMAAQAYYQFAPEQLVAADPDVILLPGSIYTSAGEFTADPRFAGLTAVKEGRVIVIDDVIVTRPGPRIAEGVGILAAAIHPEAF